jgi:predicted outer membrane repeat protein
VGPTILLVAGLVVQGLSVHPGGSGTPVFSPAGQVRSVATVCRVTDTSSGAAPSTDLQDVIDRARPGARIQVEGTCLGHFTVHRDLTVVGVPTRVQPTPTLDATDSRCGRGHPCFVVRITSRGDRPSPRVTLTNLTITGGQKYKGAGILKKEGKLTLRGSTSVTGNRAHWLGGGIYSPSGTVVLRGHASVSDNVVFGHRGTGGGINGRRVVMKGSARVTGNSAYYAGGGIAGAVVLRGHSAVTDNFVQRLGGGGGISGPSVVMRDRSRVCKNSTRYADGAGVLTSVLVMRDDATVCRNTTGGRFARGGGVVSSDVQMYGRASIRGNHSGGAGGGIWSERGSIALNDSAVVSANTADGHGGGIHSAGHLAVNDAASVTGNEAIRGGGIHQVGSSAAMNDQSSVTSNTAGKLGGGVHLSAGPPSDPEGPGTFTMTGSSVISGNSAADDGGGIYNRGCALVLYGPTAVTGNTPNDIAP